MNLPKRFGQLDVQFTAEYDQARARVRDFILGHREQCHKIINMLSDSARSSSLAPGDLDEGEQWLVAVTSCYFLLDLLEQQDHE